MDDKIYVDGQEIERRSAPTAPAAVTPEKPQRPIAAFVLVVFTWIGASMALIASMFVDVINVSTLLLPAVAIMFLVFATALVTRQLWGLIGYTFLVLVVLVVQIVRAIKYNQPPTVYVPFALWFLLLGLLWTKNRNYFRRHNQQI